LLDVMQISDILSVEDENTFTRPIYAGNAIATVRSSDAKKVITVRGTAFEKAARDGGSGSVETIDAGSDPALSRFVSAESLGERAPRADQRQDHRLGRPRAGLVGPVPRADRPARRQARRGVGAAARRSTPATRPTTIRSARPARSSPPKSMSRSASPARSSTSPE
jgi:electron transfer flavoprotein alpha subunit